MVKVKVKVKVRVKVRVTTRTRTRTSTRTNSKVKIRTAKRTIARTAKARRAAEATRNRSRAVRINASETLALAATTSASRTSASNSNSRIAEHLTVRSQDIRSRIRSHSSSNRPGHPRATHPTELARSNARRPKQRQTYPSRNALRLSSRKARHTRGRPTLHPKPATPRSSVTGLVLALSVRHQCAGRRRLSRLYLLGMTTTDEKATAAPSAP